MTETILNTIQALKIVFLGGFAWLYGAGGIYGKWKRRYVGPIYLTGGIIFFSLIQSNFSWFYLFYAPLLMLSLSVGYGENSKLRKLFKYKWIVRLITGFALAFAAIPIVIVTGQYLMFGLHILLCCAVSIFMGVGNPISARGEEVTIASIAGFLPLFFIG